VVVLGAGIAESGENNVLVAQELVDRGGIFVRGDAQDHAVTRPDVFLQPIKRRSFFDAGRAPRGPEVQDDDLAAQIREMAGFTGELEWKVFGGLPSDGCFPLAITRQREDQNNACCEGQGPPSRESSAESNGATSQEANPHEML